MNAATEAYIREHREDGAVAISSALAADPRFAAPVDTKALLAHAQTHDIDVRLKATTALGAAVPFLLQLGIDRFTEAARAGIPWNLDRQDVGLRFGQWLAGMVQFYQAQGDANSLAGLRPQDAETLRVFVGGKLLESLSATEVQAELDRQAQEAANQALRAKLANGYNAAVALMDGETLPTPAELLAAIQAELEA